MTLAGARHVAVPMLFGLFALAATPVSAQLREPRCGGWPPTLVSHFQSVLVGSGGTTCYGQIFPRMRPGVSLLDAWVVRPPARGRFRMLGLRDFEYTPDADLRGWDIIVVAVQFDARGSLRRRWLRFRATTQDYYDAIGGSAERPPSEVAPWGMGGGRHRGGHRGR